MAAVNALRALPALQVNRPIGPFHDIFDNGRNVAAMAGPAPQFLGQPFHDDLRGQAAGHIAGLVAPHAIRQDQQAQIVDRGDAVLVQAAQYPGVGLGGDFQRKGGSRGGIWQNASPLMCLLYFLPENSLIRNCPKQAVRPALCMPSQTKIGRYEVVSALGQGAMGTVYKAVDPLIERAVAIKTINLNLSKEERAEFEERFYREAKSAGRLSHANIVTIYDVGETDDIAYIAMEYLQGESLREMLDSGVVLPIEMIGRIAARIASALNYAHENHVVHRDIKPANIMITTSRDVKIMDFGIAQIPMGSRTQLGTVLGSPKYMAPEQVAGQSTDGRTDIFALGVVLYEMLAGTTPFNGDNLSAIMYQVLNAEPAPPSTLNPRVPPAFDRIVGRALAKRPEDRYPTARAFAQDLGEHDAALPPEARAAASQAAGVIRAGS